MQATALHPEEFSRPHPALVDRSARIGIGNRPLLGDPETRRLYEGFTGPTEVLGILTLADERSGDRQWLITSPPRSGKHAAELHPFNEYIPGPKMSSGSPRTKLARHALAANAPEVVARVVPVSDELQGERRIVDESQAITLHEGEGVLLSDLRAGNSGPRSIPDRSQYAEPGNGLISANTKGTVVIRTLVDESVHFVASPEAVLTEGAMYIRR